MIVEIYHAPSNTVWKDVETFLCVYDNDNNLVTDYDFVTGLKLMQDESTMTVYINDEDLVPGRWVFLGTAVTIVNGDGVDEKVRSEGFKDGDSVQPEYIDPAPWSSGLIKFTSRQQRQERLEICKACQFFDSLNVMCTVNRKNVLDFTKRDHSICPEDKWGDKDRVNAEAGLQFDFDDQKFFESELDKFLEGLL